MTSRRKRKRHTSMGTSRQPGVQEGTKSARSLRPTGHAPPLPTMHAARELHTAALFPRARPNRPPSSVLAACLRYSCTCALVEGILFFFSRYTHVALYERSKSDTRSPPFQVEG